MTAALFISGRDWLPAAGALFLAGLGLVIWSYRRAGGTGGFRLACVTLKLMGLLALGFCLLEPMLTGQRARPGANYFAVAADNSQGLQIQDAGAAASRGQQLRQALTDPGAEWDDTLAQTFQVRRYVFDARLQSVRGFSELDFTGRESAIGAALRGLRDRFQGQPLAGILLFTDGNATDLPEGVPDLAGVPPVYPVVIGSDAAIGDLSLQNVSVSQSVFEDAPVTFQAEVGAGGHAGVPVSLRVFDDTGRQVEEQTQRPGKASDRLTFRVQIKPSRPGVSFYRLAVSAADAWDQFEQPEKSREATLANNRRLVAVDRGGGAKRILYVGGRPNWEFKFLNRALADDDQLELVGLVRIARREPKFEFRGRAGEGSNPLFRGFDRKTEETERYDQPVLVRLNPRDATELAGGFPRTPEELFAYHAVIVDDLESEFFSQDQMALLQRFVSERGGGFLMLGGAESFHEGKYDRTPVGEMLPVYIDRPTEPLPKEGLRLQLSREGWLEPWVRLRGTEGEEQTRLEAMPPFETVNQARDLKPGASAVAVVEGAAGRLTPALAAQRFGSGKVGAVLVGDLWRWGLQDEVGRGDLDKLWRQLVRWLIVDVPEKVELRETVEAAGTSGRDLRVRVRDRKFEAVDDAEVRLEVREVAFGSPGATNTVASGGATNAVSLTAEPVDGEPGLYQARFVTRDAAGYLVEAVARDSRATEIGRATTGWSVDPAADEFRSLQPNRALLEAIARKTGGEVLRLDDLPRFAAGLPDRRAPITESHSWPFWHQPAFFLLALACFVAEWGLRRWRGLA